MLVLAGYVKDPKLYYPNNQAVCHMDFAFHQRSGQEPVVRHIELVVWNSETANAVCHSYQQGGYVIVEANYRNQTLEHPDGSSEYSSNLSVVRIHPGQPDLELNAAFLVGNTGADSELRQFESGATKARNRLALRRNKDSTDWISIEAWGKTAETMVQYVPKGKQIAVEGSFRIDQWLGEDGTQRSRPFIAVDRLILLGGKSASEAVDS